MLPRSSGGVGEERRRQLYKAQAGAQGSAAHSPSRFRRPRRQLGSAQPLPPGPHPTHPKIPAAADRPGPANRALRGQWRSREPPLPVKKKRDWPFRPFFSLFKLLLVQAAHLKGTGRDWVWGSVEDLWGSLLSGCIWNLENGFLLTWESGETRPTPPYEQRWDVKSSANLLCKSWEVSVRWPLRKVVLGPVVEGVLSGREPQRPRRSIRMLSRQIVKTPAECRSAASPLRVTETATKNQRWATPLGSSQSNVLHKSLHK